VAAQLDIAGNAPAARGWLHLDAKRTTRRPVPVPGCGAGIAVRAAVSSVMSAEIVATPPAGAEGREDRHPRAVRDRVKSSTAVDNK
jgi:hypothetical protein